MTNLAADFYMAVNRNVFSIKILALCGVLCYTTTVAKNTYAGFPQVPKSAPGRALYNLSRPVSEKGKHTED